MQNTTIKTTWDVRTYDVWGNAKDGYEVNDVRTRERDREIVCKVQVANAGTPQQFEYATPSDYAIKKIFGVGCAIITEGDDLTIYVNRASDSHPIGELHCTSHASLSPIRAIETAQIAKG